METQDIERLVGKVTVETDDRQSAAEEPELPRFEYPSPQQVQARQSRSAWKGIFWGLLAGLGGFAITRLLLSAGSEPDPERIRLSGLQKLLVFGSLPIHGFLVILLHELGHIVGGKLAGLRFLLLVVGPLKVVRGERGLTWQVNRSAALMGGLACCLPTKAEGFLKALFWMIIGGPLASLLVAAFGFGLFPVISSLELEPTWQKFALIQAGFLSLMSTAIFFVTAWPAAAGGMKTDGRQVLELLKSNDATKRQNLIRLLVGQSLAGVRPSEWDRNVIQELEELYADLEDNDRNRSEIVIWSTMRAAVAIDDHDHHRAHQTIQYSLTHCEHYPAFARGSLYLEAALFECRVRKDAKAAKALIEAAPQGALVEAYAPLAARAELAWLQGDHKGALQLAEQALQAMDSAIDAAGVVVEKESMLEIVDGTRNADFRSSEE